MNYLALHRLRTAYGYWELRRDGRYLIQVAEVRSTFRLVPGIPTPEDFGSISTIEAKSVARNESAEMALGQSRRLGYRGGLSSD
jgi:hypothetical protein